jgi:hypothetical protein
MCTNFIKITEYQYNAFVKDAKKNNVFVAEIDGNKLKNCDDYLVAVWKAFNFPQTGYVNYYAYLDWIRDLGWIIADEFAFIVRNFNHLLEESPKERKIIINSLDNKVIPWWQSEIEQFVVEGKAKPFNVYLVD